MERKQAAAGSQCNQKGKIDDTNHSPDIMTTSKAPGEAFKSAIARSVPNNNDNEEQGRLTPTHDNKPVCGSQTVARPVGLKRKISHANGRKERKRRNSQPKVTIN